MVLWTWCALVLGRARVSAPGLSPVVERLAVTCPTSSSATGLRFAYGRARLDSGFARASLWGSSSLLLAWSGTHGWVEHRPADRRSNETQPPPRPAVPYLLVVLILALGVLTVAHAMFTSARHRRRDLAVLGALGADRSWLARVVHWQATTSG